MNLVNTTNLVAGYTMATDKAGRESIVVVAKGTYRVPTHAGGAPELSDEQVPLVTCDTFTGEPGFSASLYETDFSPPKPRCDVLLNGRCYAPGGMPQERVTVGLRVGLMAKSFTVVGRRVYRMGLLYGVTASGPEPFTVMPISYDNAYGGVDRTNEDPGQHQWHPLNHAGVGYHPKAPAHLVDGRPLPNTEESHRPATKPAGDYVPMAFGPLGRGWRQRIKWAGTYDQNWLDDQFPFLPEDFDPRYFQCAPEDQQTDYLRGGEEVELLNLTPQGQTSFCLPADLSLPVVFDARDGTRTETAAVVDTVVFEPDRQRFMLCWRAARALRRNIREVVRVTVGRGAQDLTRQADRDRRVSVKRQFRDLEELVGSSRQRRGAGDRGEQAR